MTHGPTCARPDRSPGLAARVLAVPVHAYRLLLSPLLGPNCRYYPTCSAYALDALRVHGALKGSWLSVQRVCRCHPWHPGGYDPVPAPADRHSHSRIEDAFRHE